MTYENSQQTFFDETEFPLMSSAEASPARISQAQGKWQVLTESEAVYGAKSSAFVASFSQVTSLWRTSQTSLQEGREAGSQEFSVTWPRSGTMRHGTVSQLPTLAHSINETVSGSSLIPTPTACDYKGSGVPRIGRGPKNNLRDWFKWHFRLQYPPVMAVEYMMGFPIGHTDLEP